MADAWKKETVHRVLEEIQTAASSLGDLDPDLHEKLDEWVLSVYDQYDIAFVRCDSCDEDLINDEHHCIKQGDKRYCLDCHRRDELARADTGDYTPAK